MRHLADEAVGARPVTIDLSVRRLYCENPQCPKSTFVEQVEGLTRRYQPRTPALQRVLDAVAVHLAGKAGARLLLMLHQVVSWATLLRALMTLPLPDLPTPRVVGWTISLCGAGIASPRLALDALTGRRVDVLPDRTAATPTSWLRAHPGVEVVVRDGSASYAQAIDGALPDAVQVRHRWHLWHGLGAAVDKTVAAHAGLLACSRGRGGPRLL